MDLGIKGRSVIVTGGARGIGAGIAKAFLEEGADVTVWDVSFSAGGRPAVGGANAMQRVVDITDYNAVVAGVHEVVSRTGGLDILVNNAGINGCVAPLAEYDIEEWDRVLRVDLTGVFYCTKAAIPTMKANGYGRIINIASMAGKDGNPGIAAYASAKAGVIALTKSVARELAGENILVNAVAPAITETELFAEMTAEHIAAGRAKIPMNRFVHVDEIAATTLWVASERCSFTTGFTFDVSGGRATY
ncbi:SDR family NAD(P)-dependent oxidoreductase (plasmid) [Agrobacterium leguminum]|uniref:3-oxoacyl-[acyl-carrier-protein] reductase n=1 Tax=Agrobacterium deltaense NCPPB 1641 TaxID=1183425 RepID=A0A1S7UB89_9HYPH|nr:MULTISPECIES: SDR family NAD(P)-dependent oxidoreductase [Agrobacterium]WFS69758.1 SDR family NAD(P)-dependent oxidoreductase [Agrobacterium leguminum]CVI64069.1 conserved hypothetical protein [Agrobacterium deltaense NCPPB 1641]